MKLSNIVERKFEDVVKFPDFLSIEVDTNMGYKKVTHSNKTIPYKVYEVLLLSGNYIKCADTHIFIDKNGEEVFAKDCLNKTLKTKYGEDLVVSVKNLGYDQNMYDLSVDSEEHLYYTNGILSHNTTSYAVDILHDVIFNEDYRVGITSYKNANVIDFMDRIRYTLESLPFFLKPAVSIYNTFSIKFDNGSSIRAQVTAGNTFRGFTLERIICDELAFVKPAIADAFIASLLPSLEGDGDSSTTKLQIISTPNGTEGAFPTIWFGAVAGTNGFVPIEVKYEEIPGRTEEFEKKMLGKMGRDKFEQEFKNKFIGSGGTLINSRVMESINTIDAVDKFGELDLFVDSLQGRKIAIACDVSEGVGKDNHCIQMIDIDTFEQIGEFANNVMNQTLYAREIIKIIEHLYKSGVTDIFYTVESNSIGQGVLRLLEHADNTFLDNATLICDINKDGTVARQGMYTSNSAKLDGCLKLKDLVETNKLKINSKKLLTELKFFVSKGASFSGDGMPDDRVMAMVILVNSLKYIANYEDKVHDTINNIEDLEDETWGISF